MLLADASLFPTLLLFFLDEQLLRRELELDGARLVDRTDDAACIVACLDVVV